MKRVTSLTLVLIMAAALIGSADWLMEQNPKFKVQNKVPIKAYSLPV